MVALEQGLLEILLKLEKPTLQLLEETPELFRQLEIQIMGRPPRCMKSQNYLEQFLTSLKIKLQR